MDAVNVRECGFCLLKSVPVVALDNEYTPVILFDLDGCAFQEFRQVLCSTDGPKGFDEIIFGVDRHFIFSNGQAVVPIFGQDVSVSGVEGAAAINGSFELNVHHGRPKFVCTDSMNDVRQS